MRKRPDMSAPDGRHGSHPRCQVSLLADLVPLSHPPATSRPGTVELNHFHEESISHVKNFEGW
jgi:hypothetical protein